MQKEERKRREKCRSSLRSVPCFPLSRSSARHGSSRAFKVSSERGVSEILRPSDASDDASARFCGVVAPRAYLDADNSSPRSFGLPHPLHLAHPLLPLLSRVFLFLFLVPAIARARQRDFGARFYVRSRACVLSSHTTDILSSRVFLFSFPRLQS